MRREHPDGHNTLHAQSRVRFRSWTLVCWSTGNLKDMARSERVTGTVACHRRCTEPPAPRPGPKANLKGAPWHRPEKPSLSRFRVNLKFDGFFYVVT